MSIIVPFEKDRWDPNSFSLQLYQIYAEIANKRHIKSYDHLSSGINYFPMLPSIKKCLIEEIHKDMYYSKYTPLKGLQFITSCLQLMHNFIATKGNFTHGIPDNDLCMTIGASQGISMIYKYIKDNTSRHKIMVIGMCFPIFFQLAEAYGMECIQCLDETDTGVLPKIDDLISYLELEKPGLIVLTIPNNPNGKYYTNEELSYIFRIVKKLNTFLLIDITGLFLFSEKETPKIEQNILNANIHSQFAIVNSFSKTYSLSGYRIGYVYSCKDVITYIQKQMSRDIVMNPTLVTALPIVMITILTCIYINKKENWSHTDVSIQKLFRKIFHLSSSNNVGFQQNKIVNSLFTYNKDQLKNMTYEFSQNNILIKNNQHYFFDKLYPHIDNYIPVDNGFNMLVRFRAFHDWSEEKAAKRFFEKTQLSILTESCFCACKAEGSFNIRISSAIEPEQFIRMVNQIDLCLKNW